MRRWFRCTSSMKPWRRCRHGLVGLPKADGNADDARVSAGIESLEELAMLNIARARHAARRRERWPIFAPSLGVRVDPEPAHAFRLVRRGQRDQGFLDVRKERGLDLLRRMFREARLSG